MQTGSQLLGPHQLTEIIHQLTPEIPTLIQEDLFGQPIVDNEIVPEGFDSCLGSLRLCNIHFGILGEVVCYH